MDVKRKEKKSVRSIKRGNSCNSKVRREVVKKLKITSRNKPK